MPCRNLHRPVSTVDSSTFCSGLFERGLRGKPLALRETGLLVDGMEGRVPASSLESGDLDGEQNDAVSLLASELVVLLSSSTVLCFFLPPSTVDDSDFSRFLLSSDGVRSGGHFVSQFVMVALSEKEATL